MRKIKVLFFDHESILSGGERSLLDIIRYINREKYEPFLATPSNGPLVDFAKEKDVTTFLIPMDDRVKNFTRDKKHVINFFLLVKILPTVIKILNIIKAEDIDIVYTNSMKAHIIGSICAKLTGRKLIWHVRDILEKGILLKILSCFALAPNRIICVSNAVKNQFSTKIKKRCVVIYNGIIPLDEGSKTVRIVKNNDFVVGMVGQLARWKGQDILVKVARRLTRKYNNISFVIVGDALFQAENDFKKMLIEMSKGIKKIYFTGYRKDSRNIMKSFDVLVHASRKPEPFGRVIIEAMDSQIPVIASNLGGPKEIINDNTSGFLFSPNDFNKLELLIEMCYKNKGMIEKIKINEKNEFDKCFNLKKTINEIENVIDSL